MSYYMKGSCSDGSQYTWAIITDATQCLALCQLSGQRERCGPSCRKLSFRQEVVRKV